MTRDTKLYLDDIRAAIAKIRRYTRKMNGSEFSRDDKTVLW
ncbi:MAG: hypothetical protein WC421_04025 [Elusimicrobiales bacterium]